jgi:hypothetical protein
MLLLGYLLVVEEILYKYRFLMRSINVFINLMKIVWGQYTLVRSIKSCIKISRSYFFKNCFNTIHCKMTKVITVYNYCPDWWDWCDDLWSDQTNINQGPRFDHSINHHIFLTICAIDLIRPFLVFSLFCVSSKLWNLPASQGKKQTSFKKQNCFCMLCGRQTLQKFDLFHISINEILNKV